MSSDDSRPPGFSSSDHGVGELGRADASVNVAAGAVDSDRPGRQSVQGAGSLVAQLGSKPRRLGFVAAAAAVLVWSGAVGVIWRRASMRVQRTAPGAIAEVEKLDHATDDGRSESGPRLDASATLTGAVGATATMSGASPMPSANAETARGALAASQARASALTGQGATAAPKPSSPGAAPRAGSDKNRAKKTKRPSAPAAVDPWATPLPQFPIPPPEPMQPAPASPPSLPP